MRFLINAEGELVAEQDIKAAVGVDVGLRDDALVRYLVTNLGWIELAVTRRGIKVAARPRMLSDASKVSLFFTLQDARMSPIYLSVMADGGLTQRFASVRNLMSFLTEMNAAPQSPHWLGNDRLLRKPVSVGKSRFNGILAQASMVAYNVDDPNRATSILTRLFSARWSVCEQTENDGKSYVLAQNGQYQFGDQSPDTRTMLQRYADAGFARWISEFHTSVLDSMTPQIDHVDVVANVTSLGETRLRYEAITVPIIRRDGSRILICGAVDDCAIDLRKPLDQVA